MFRVFCKKISALILLLAFAAQSFSQGIALIQFHIQRAYIIKTQCINRYRPMMHCDGKCVLAQKLKQQEKKEKQNPDLKMDARHEVVSSRSFFSTLVLNIISTPKKYFLFSDNRTADRPADFFHPPGA